MSLTTEIAMVILIAIAMITGVVMTLTNGNDNSDGVIDKCQHSQYMAMAMALYWMHW